MALNKTELILKVKYLFSFMQEFIPRIFRH